MTPEVNSLIEQIGHGLLRSAPEQPWQSMDLELTGAGGMLGSNLTVNIDDEQALSTISIDDDTEDACADLRDAMYRPKIGTWYNCRFNVRPDGSVTSEFDYDNAPFHGNFAPDLLINDQGDFPRDDEHLPEWHPAKAQA